MTELTNEQFLRLIQSVPINPTNSRFHLSREEGEGTLTITDVRGEYEMIIKQSPSSFKEWTRPKEAYLFQEKPNNFSIIGNIYLPSFFNRGYSLIDGRMIFNIGSNGNPDNPDNLRWDDSYLDIEENSFNLVIGNRLSHESRTNLEGWFN